MRGALDEMISRRACMKVIGRDKACDASISCPVG
ncbi:hypothetical protein FOQG_16835 [Fusarium oxysporum f. sp. raphani 54005]|uniref:Uncharacterized protein n=2 Tax=Fusarium oxysporum TaxID=5507 RepID=X0C6Y0_FUSOX|nr:hypothetical protein FOVG_11172 [Fusarium oxysporum f. sp. pisi HDV247]EXK78487.1 hypothetical protein FOQG_16835 [Fusarium oxysporum f. sp. raphani 54005]